MKNQELRNSGRRDFGERELSSLIIDAAIQVHKALGPGYLESSYEEALCIEFTDREVPYERQKTIRIEYKGKPVGEHRLDLLLDRRIVIELKTVSELNPIHFSVVRSYMKAVGINDGMILNFSTMPMTVKGVGFHASFPEFLIS